LERLHAVKVDLGDQVVQGFDDARVIGSWLVFRGIGNLMGIFTTILEGDGGVLWALLLLTLIISLFRTGGAP
jgi:hypothetical protein